VWQGEWLRSRFASHSGGPRSKRLALLFVDVDVGETRQSVEDGEQRARDRTGQERWEDEMRRDEKMPGGSLLVRTSAAGSRKGAQAEKLLVLVPCLLLILRCWSGRRSDFLCRAGG
jgi:hypothetical protein